MSCPRSSAPDRAWSPMSEVPPSPAMATALMGFLGMRPLRISAFSPASTPDPTAAAFSKATWIQGTSHAVVGKAEEIISMHPVALAMTIFWPRALSTYRTAKTSALPWQARWPGTIGSFPDHNLGTYTWYLSIFDSVIY